jgi:hypothetical protein
MAGFSKTLATSIFNATLNGAGRTNLTAITNLYAALHTEEPGDSSAPASEVAYTGYERVDVGDVFVLGSDETSGGEVTLVVQNSAAVEFGASASTSPTTVSHWAIWKVSTGGVADDLVYSGELLDSNGDATTREIQEGDIPLFQIGQFKIKLV